MTIFRCMLVGPILLSFCSANHSAILCCSYCLFATLIASLFIQQFSLLLYAGLLLVSYAVL